MKTKEIPIIKYSKKWFNPLFFILEDILDNNTKVSNIYIYGGKSSSKTASICQQFAKRGLEKRQSSMLFRKESSRVKTTIKPSFKLGINTTRLTNGWHQYEREFRSVTGAEAILTGLDSEDKAKGVEGFDFVLFDELDQFEPKEHEQADLSLRGEGNKVLFGTWNPVSKMSWVKTKLVDSFEWLETDYKLPDPKSFVNISSCGTTILIKTSYLDNYWTVGSPCGTYGFRDEKLIAKYFKLKTTDYNAYKVNVLGEWGNVQRGGEFYKNFRAETQVKKHTYDPNLPLHISFDENVNPYLSLSVYQAKGLKSWKIKEICLEHPFNTLSHTLNKFKTIFPSNKETIFIYGDRTSLKQDTKLEKGQNFFTIIEDDLKRKGCATKLRLPKQNPSVSSRGNFINEIFGSNIYDIEYSIDENCNLTIDDYENVKESSDGTKHKEKTKHPTTKVTYEKYGHLTDTDDYFICEYYKNEYEKYLNPKKKKQPTTAPRNS
ncbi:phage terminase large subunit [Flavobacterium sp. LB2P84]|uniref:phage terminase large subunit n=1 Tax=Flavobacterium yafengii TaxID=3041253 RepID=UPI0024A9B5C4|nr:phage terminase large subunit [Flavobacterium yafengii]MDI6033995.1 phage terminase large subunit [Flavobacterium yafengii]